MTVEQLNVFDDVHVYRDPYLKTEPITVEQLNALSNIQVIEDYLSVSAVYNGFTSLSFLRNLHTIKGQRLKKR